jgi:hypothetical protein
VSYALSFLLEKAGLHGSGPRRASGALFAVQLIVVWFITSAFLFMGAGPQTPDLAALEVENSLYGSGFSRRHPAH